MSPCGVRRSLLDEVRWWAFVPGGEDVLPALARRVRSDDGAPARRLGRGPAALRLTMTDSWSHYVVRRGACLPGCIPSSSDDAASNARMARLLRLHALFLVFTGREKVEVGWQIQVLRYSQVGRYTERTQRRVGLH